MREIPLTQGKVALVDDGDYEWLMQWKWFAEKRVTRRGIVTWYARTNKTNGHHYMHRLILSLLGSALEGDHGDGNGLNNQRFNLRGATKTQNCQNQQLKRNNTSGFKGVCFNKSYGKWRARITVNKQDIELGFFSDKATAAIAYNNAATQHFGEFAQLNPV